MRVRGGLDDRFRFALVDDTAVYQW